MPNPRFGNYFSFCAQCPRQNPIYYTRETFLLNLMIFSSYGLLCKINVIIKENAEQTNVYALTVDVKQASIFALNAGERSTRKIINPMMECVGIAGARN